MSYIYLDFLVNYPITRPKKKGTETERNRIELSIWKAFGLFFLGIGNLHGVVSNCGFALEYI